MAHKMTDKERVVALSAAGLNDEAIAAILGTDLDTVKRLSTDLTTLPADQSKTALGLTLTDHSTHQLPVTDGVRDSGIGLDFTTDSGLALIAFRAILTQPADSHLPQLLLDGEVAIGDNTFTVVGGPFTYAILADGTWNSWETPPPAAAGALLLDIAPGHHRLSYGYDSPDSGGSISDVRIAALPL